MQTPSITFRHLPLNSAITSYDTIERALCLSPRIHHTLSIAFRHRPPNSAITSYDTIEGALCLSPRIHHTLSIAFRHRPPNSAITSYDAVEEALYLSPRTCLPKSPLTLRESLSGTFLQTLPDLVTPLKGHSLPPRSCPPTRSASSERFGH